MASSKYQPGSLMEKYIKNTSVTGLYFSVHGSAALGILQESVKHTKMHQAGENLKAVVGFDICY